MRHEESKIQKLMVRHFITYFPQYRGLLFSVPNGAYLGGNIKRAANLKAEGVVSGVSDLIFLKPNATHHALLIEVKTAKGRQSPNQKNWEAIVTPHGYKYIIVRSVADFHETLTKYLKNE